MSIGAIKKKLIGKLKDNGFYCINITLPAGGIPNVIACAPNGRFVAFNCVNKITENLPFDKTKNANSILQCAGLWVDFDGIDSPEAEAEFQKLIDKTKKQVNLNQQEHNK